MLSHAMRLLRLAALPALAAVIATSPPEAVAATVTDFSGEWRSSETCGEYDGSTAEYGYQWFVRLEQDGDGVAGSIYFNDCVTTVPAWRNRSYATYIVSGRATSARLLGVHGVKIFRNGRLQSDRDAPLASVFVLRRGQPPLPNYAIEEPPFEVHRWNGTISAAVDQLEYDAWADCFEVNAEATDLLAVCPPGVEAQPDPPRTTAADTSADDGAAGSSADGDGDGDAAAADAGSGDDAPRIAGAILGGDESMPEPARAAAAAGAATAVVALTTLISVLARGAAAASGTAESVVEAVAEGVGPATSEGEETWRPLTPTTTPGTEERLVQISRGERLWTVPATFATEEPVYRVPWGEAIRGSMDAWISSMPSGMPDLPPQVMEAVRAWDPRDMFRASRMTPILQRALGREGMGALIGDVRQGIGAMGPTQRALTSYLSSGDAIDMWAASAQRQIRIAEQAAEAARTSPAGRVFRGVARIFDVMEVRDRWNEISVREGIASDDYLAQAGAAGLGVVHTAAHIAIVALNPVVLVGDIAATVPSGGEYGVGRALAVAEDRAFDVVAHASRWWGELFADAPSAHHGDAITPGRIGDTIRRVEARTDLTAEARLETARRLRGLLR